MSDMTTKEIGWRKCEGSGRSQAVDWDADDKGYPGASVCPGCQYGVLLRKGSIRPGVSVSGREGLFGRLRVHYVKWERREMGPHPTEPVRMTYKKPKAARS